MNRLTVEDIIKAGGCPLGIRRWFAEREDLPEGLTMKSFIREGITIEQAKALDDAFVNRALQIKGVL